MKTKKLLTFTVLMLAILFLAGCGNSWRRIEGNGQVITELRTMPPFNEIVNDGEFNVYIEQDSVFEVSIEAESNLVPYIRTRVNGTTLHIDTRENLRDHYGMNLYITTPDVYAVTLNGSGLITSREMIITENLDLGISGSGNIDFDVEADLVRVGISGSGSADMNIFCDALVATITGSGDMYFHGLANRGDYRISGSGTIRADNMELNECYATISGSGSIYVTVLEYLEATISGSGSIYYYGDPSVSTNISGSGSVIKL